MIKYGTPILVKIFKDYKFVKSYIEIISKKRLYYVKK